MDWVEYTHADSNSLRMELPSTYITERPLHTQSSVLNMSCKFEQISVTNLDIDYVNEIPGAPGIPFSLTCNSNVWLSFEGTCIVTEAGGDPVIVVATMNYYNPLAPAGVSIASPLQFTCVEGAPVTFTAVQLASALAPGTYYARVYIAKLIPSYGAEVTVNGMFSITTTPTGL